MLLQTQQPFCLLKQTVQTCGAFPVLKNGDVGGECPHRPFAYARSGEGWWTDMAEWKVALAAIAAIVGAGFASGREIVSFFTMHGKWWPLGAAACCAAAGLLTAMLVQLARRTKSASLPQLYTRVMDEKCGEAVQVVYALMLLIVCAAMCSAAAEMGALALDSRFARPAGAACALALSLFGAKSRGHLAGSGLIAAGVLFVFYCALCVRGPQVTAPVQQNGALVSTGLGVLYACLNVALAAGVICCAGQESASPARAGLFTGILLLALLVPACVAVKRLGDTSLALPSVALAGEMGLFGFWASLAALFAAAVSTLASGLYSLKRQLADAGLPEKWCMSAAVLGAVTLSVVGFAPIVNVAYPLLGFLCAMLLPALALFVKD